MKDGKMKEDEYFLEHLQAEIRLAVGKEVGNIIFEGFAGVEHEKTVDLSGLFDLDRKADHDEC